MALKMIPEEEAAALDAAAAAFFSAASELAARYGEGADPISTATSLAVVSIARSLINAGATTTGEEASFLRGLGTAVGTILAQSADMEHAFDTMDSAVESAIKNTVAFYTPKGNA